MDGNGVELRSSSLPFGEGNFVIRLNVQQNCVLLLIKGSGQTNGTTQSTFQETHFENLGVAAATQDGGCNYEPIRRDAETKQIQTCVETQRR